MNDFIDSNANRYKQAATLNADKGYDLSKNVSFNA